VRKENHNYYLINKYTAKKTPHKCDGCCSTCSPPLSPSSRAHDSCLSHSTPSHPMSDGLWQWLGVLSWSAVMGLHIVVIPPIHPTSRGLRQWWVVLLSCSLLFHHSRTQYSPREQSLMAVVGGAGCHWCRELVSVGVVVPPRGVGVIAVGLPRCLPSSPQAGVVVVPPIIVSLPPRLPPPPPRLPPVRATLQSARISHDTCKGKPKLIRYENIENIYTPCKGKPKRKV
jgi:hypothetical protein